MVGRCISNFTPRMPHFVLLFTDLKTKSLKIFDSPSEFQTPKDFFHLNGSQKPSGFH